MSSPIGVKSQKSIFLILAALLIFAACSTNLTDRKPAPSADVQELNTAELDSASADLDQMDQDINDAEFESLDAELAELEGLEYG